MAYAAVISLKHTIEHLILLVPSSIEIIEFARKEVNSLHKQLKELNIRSRKRSVNALDEGMREELCKFEDLIESHLSNLLLSQSKSVEGHLLSFSVDLQDLKPEIRRFTVALKKMKWAYLRETSNMCDDDDDDDSGGNKPNIVGYSDHISNIKGRIANARGWSKVFSFVGMAGIGKTTLAKQFFDDPDIVKHFEYRVWVKVGRKKCKYIDIAQQILAQLNPDSNKLVNQGDEEIIRDLQNFWKSKRCVIILDDVWDTRFIEDLMNRLCWITTGESWVFITTRLHEVVRAHKFKMELWNKEESWHLFCAKVFDGELYPPELVESGMKIAEKCEGLPLLIITVANLLSKKEKSLENWSMVAEDKRNQLLKDACKEIEEVLFPSYDHLPAHLKTCFLYMGVFPQDYEIPKSNIINLWTAEGFLELNEDDTSHSCAMNCLNKLVSNNIVLLYQRSSGYAWAESDIVKTCGLHCSFWYLCNREAEKNKFLHVFNILEDSLEENIKGHRRLCIHNNVLFGIKDVYTSIERVCATTARSLLCFGPYHQYMVPICFGLRFLKVLDALAIRFYDFPLEVLKLVLLRYLAVTCNGKLPPSITKLRRLEFLIVGRHLSIKSCRDPCYLPMEIWDVKELKHLQIMGSDLPDPCGKLLPKLLKLIGVGVHSCTKEVLEGVPHLKKLEIQIELEPNSTEPLRCFDHISALKELKSLKCVVVNPMFVTPPAPFSMMPSSCLQKLHLSGLGYSWEYMTIIAATLPNLEELKLRCYAFQGQKWDLQETYFPKLRVLFIEDTDLVQLKAARGIFPNLNHISLKHCYRLQELHLDILSVVTEIELVDCNPLVVNYVQQNIEAKFRGIHGTSLVVHCSWNDGNLKLSQPTKRSIRQPTNLSKRKFIEAR